MLPSNVVSFMKKMVTSEVGSGGGEDTALSKLRHTLSSSLMTAQDKVTKLGPSRQSETPPPPATPEIKPPEEPQKHQNEVKPVNRAGACRVCLKSFKPEDFSRTCGECQQKVCEDCASYSKPDDNQDEASWKCSICRRKAASRAQAAAIVGQDSTESLLLEPPGMETLQRRHSEAKLGAPGGPSLLPPRSPELRRHSDVSPASLKELEKAVLKVASEREWRQRGRGSATGSPGGSRATSPSVERRPFPSSEQPRTSTKHSGGLTADDVGSGIEVDSAEEAWRRSGASRGRRKSRVQKQHSYDDDKAGGQQASSLQTQDPSLGLPAALPRRASAYDVFATRSGEALQMATPSRDPSTGRRSSFRAVPQDHDDTSSSSPLSPDSGPSLGVDDERRSRRRGSQLPDIGALHSGHRAQQGRTLATPIVRTPDTEVVRRQTSVTDGEAIKIVIHDVDCDTASFGSRTISKRRVTLRRDPTDKAHRTRGFGMRVVGGKTGIDGRMFAYIVWTVPAGPAEKGGLQQGDKVLEWGGVSLVDKTFEEVCSIMDRTGESVELLVEHGNDLRMCDLLDEPIPNLSRKNSGDALILGLDGDVDKSPASPTRRKLPKTPV